MYPTWQRIILEIAGVDFGPPKKEKAPKQEQKKNEEKERLKAEKKAAKKAKAAEHKAKENKEKPKESPKTEKKSAAGRVKLFCRSILSKIKLEKLSRDNFHPVVSRRRYWRVKTKLWGLRYY